MHITELFLFLTDFSSYFFSDVKRTFQLGDFFYLIDQIEYTLNKGPYNQFTFGLDIETLETFDVVNSFTESTESSVMY